MYKHLHYSGGRWLFFLGVCLLLASPTIAQTISSGKKTTKKTAGSGSVAPVPPPVPPSPPPTPAMLERKDSLALAAKPEIERLDTIPKEQHKERAKSLFHLLLLEQYSILEKNFDTTKIAARAVHLERIWGAAKNILGEFRSISEIRSERQAIGDVVTVEAQFKNADFDFRFNFSDNHNVIGFSYSPSKHKYTPADSTLVGASSETEITVNSGEYTLPGFLTLPKDSAKQRFPIALLLHDQGPQDRDRSDNGYKPNKDLALGLGKLGIATLRYDKRMRLYQLKEKDVERYTINDEVVTDAVAALQTVRSLAKTYPIDTNRIVIIAPTLSAMVLPRILQQDELLSPSSRRVAGAVALALNYVKLYELMMPRFEHFFAQDGLTMEEVKQQTSIKRRIETVESPKLSLKTSIYDLPYGIPAKYWLDLRPYNHVEAISNLSLPLMLLYGEQDHDVDFTMNGLAWKKKLEGKGNVEWKSYPKLFHLFAEGNGTIRDYDRKGNVDAGLINDIAQWIGKR